MRRHSVRRATSALAVALLCVSAAIADSLLAAPAAAGPDGSIVPDYRTRTDQVELDRIGIRFEQGTGARVRAGALVSDAGADLSVVRAVVAAVPGAELAPRFPIPEETLAAWERTGESRTRQDLPDLNLFALLRLPAAADDAAGRARLGTLLAELNTAPGVAEAWALPIPQPASFLAVVPVAPALPNPLAEDGTRSDTPDFSSMQGYLYDAPVGIRADAVWSHPGGLGQGVKVIDMEWGWLWEHEDLKPPFYWGNPNGPSDHGTAVLGEYAGQHNGYGVNGIAPEVEIGGIHLGDVAADIAEAVGVLSPGDLYVMEIQVGGPQNWMPVEWWPDVFAIIQTGSALGILCMQAAGNGSVNLDDALYYGTYFDRNVRDSGALMCGAGTPQELQGEWFTNYGTRVSLQGWGSSVVTTCCGDLQGGDPEVRYTAGFNGTSSATPIVTGATASLQGQALALFGEPLTPALAEEILRATGSPYAGTKQIGPRPNLVAARERLLQGFGEVLVRVRDGETLDPMAGMRVQIAETGRLHLTGPEGEVRMQLSAGPLTFRVLGDFYYPQADFAFVVEAGEMQEAVLDLYRAPAGSLAGVVRDPSEQPIPDATVEVLDTPLVPAVSGPTGAYEVGGIPEGTGYTAIAFNAPGFGASHADFDVVGEETTPWSPLLPEAETFESGPAGYTATGEWERGLPTFPPTGRPVPFSGTNCWGIDLDGPYDNYSISNLTSPIYDMSAAETLTLSFHHWYWMEIGDGGQVQVYDPAETRWETVSPIGGYPMDSVPMLNGPGYSGEQREWKPAVFDLDAYAGGAVQVRLLFRSDASGYKVGWYIDDVALDTGATTVAVDFTPDPPARSTLLSVGPNPTALHSSLRFEVPQTVRGTCAIYDLSGARVRTIAAGELAAGVHELSWDGRDGAGRSVGSGLYFFRLELGNEVLTGRWLRIR